MIICHGNIRKRAEVRAGELLREIAERKERHAGKACQGVARCYPTEVPKLSDLGVTKWRCPCSSGKPVACPASPLSVDGDCRATLSAPANLKT